MKILSFIADLLDKGQQAKIDSLTEQVKKLTIILRESQQKLQSVIEGD